MSTTLGRPITRPSTPENILVREKDLGRYYSEDHMTGWAKNALMNARRRAKRKQTGCSLTLGDILRAAELVDHCPVTDTPLRFGRGYGKPASQSASIDRIDNTKPYTPDNIAVISSRANSLKGNCTLDELVKIGDYARRQLLNTSKEI